MGAEIKSFPGVSDPARGVEQQPVPHVIELLERRLAQARAGEIRGIAVAVVDPGGEIETEAKHDGLSGNLLSGAVAHLFYDYMRNTRDEAENADLA